MARPRQPTEVLELRGAFLQNPQRARPIGPKSERPLGDPPASMLADEQGCWREAVSNAPLGVLTSGDRILVERVSRLWAKDRREGLSGAEGSQLMQGLTKLGWTPADRSRVTARQEAEESPWDNLTGGSA